MAKLGQRHTMQRDAILNVIMNADGPLTVNEIHTEARRTSPNMGIATVYRTIKLLLDASQIQPVKLPDGETRYEPTDLDHHCHFQCELCGHVVNLEVCLVKPTPTDGMFSDYQVASHKLTLFGVCPECAAKDAPANTAKVEAGAR